MTILTCGTMRTTGAPATALTAAGARFPAPGSVRPVRQVPLRWSPRPVRALASVLGLAAIAVGYRLLVAVAIAGTTVHALLWWPESVLLALVVVGVAAGVVMAGQTPGRAR